MNSEFTRKGLCLQPAPSNLFLFFFFPLLQYKSTCLLFSLSARDNLFNRSNYATSFVVQAIENQFRGGNEYPRKPAFDG